MSAASLVSPKPTQGFTITLRVKSCGFPTFDALSLPPHGPCNSNQHCIS